MSHTAASEQEHPRITSAVQWLLAINVAIFFVQLAVWDALPSALGFRLDDLTGSWWKIGTYIFVHAGLLHLAANMYMLWVFGPRVESVWGAAAFTRFYIWCGLGGWLFHLFFDRSGLLVGSSAAVLGVMLAYAMRWPNDTVYLIFLVPMKVKWLVAVLGAVNLLVGVAATSSFPESGSGIAYFAHAGGLAFAWLYLRTPSAKSIERLRNRISPVPELDENPRPIPRSLPRSRDRDEYDEIVAKSKAAMSRRPAAPAAAARPTPREESPSELDSVLDKISEQGIESLTPEERRLLEDASKKLRQPGDEED